jgi:hypothetical protein
MRILYAEGVVTPPNLMRQCIDFAIVVLDSIASVEAHVQELKMTAHEL